MDLVLRMRQYGVDNRGKAAARNREFAGIALKLDHGGDQARRVGDLTHGGMKHAMQPSADRSAAWTAAQHRARNLRQWH